MDSQDESRSARKHRAIVEAATTAFLSKGYPGTSMDEIAALAAVSKRTVYQHFSDKDRLFSEIVLSTTDQIDGLVRLVADTLADTTDVRRDLDELARRFLGALVQPQLVQLRRLVIANADHFPDLGRAWYERGFERVLATLAGSFQRLADRGLLQLDDPLLAAHHFVGQLLWIPVNQVMFTGDTQFETEADIQRYADAAVRAFLTGYGPPAARAV
jgi:TetR/AcrR family transcriptional regulator, mexJK operon transcriptional repressor